MQKPVSWPTFSPLPIPQSLVPVESIKSSKKRAVVAIYTYKERERATIMRISSKSDKNNNNTNEQQKAATTVRAQVGTTAERVIINSPQATCDGLDSEHWPRHCLEL